MSATATSEGVVHDCGECARLRDQVRRLTLVAQDQAKALADLTDDVGPAPPSLSIVYWLYGPTRWSTRSWLSEQARLKPLLRHLGDLPAARLTPLAWSQHAARRKMEPDHRGNFPADVLLNQELGRAKQLLSWAVANRLCKYNPLSAAPRIKAVSRRETWLPLGDIDRLLAACDDVVDKRLEEGDDDGMRAKALRALVLCLHDSMLRFMEAAGMRRERIGQDGRVELAGRDVKGGRRRTIFLTPRTLEAIAALPVHDFVFSDGEERLRPRRLRYWFRDLCRVAGVDSLVAPGENRVRPHDLRASGATTADEHGAGATAIRDALGHRSLSTTAVYLRSGQADNARAATNVIISATRRPALRAPRKKERSSTRSLSK